MFGRWPALRLAVSLLVLAAAGAVLLAQPACVPLDEREARFFVSRHYWQCAFDALSAVCGAGLLTYGFERDYTDTGRGVLTGLGMIGALLYMAAWLRVLRVWQTRSGLIAPHAMVVTGVFLALQAATLAVAWLVAWLRSAADDPLRPVWLAAAGFSSLGWFAPRDGAEAVTLALVATVGMLGWPVWLLAAAAWRKTLGAGRILAVPVAFFFAFLLAAAVLICVLEAPRGGVRPYEDTSLSGQTWPVRFGRGLVQTAAAAGAGAATEPLADRGVSDGTRVVLAVVVVVGGFGGCAAGGIGWILVAGALGRAPRAATGAIPDGGGRIDAAPWQRAALRVVVAMAAATLACAIGLLAIEGLTASRFQTAPTFAEALVDAASAVGGGGMTAGLTEAVTSRRLVSGIGLGINQYQFGMIWLMLAMLGGRVLPLAILSREGGLLDEVRDEL